jgi:multidrug efflux system membrane fusion protein
MQGETITRCNRITQDHIEMAFKLRGSHIVAAAILAALGGWMYTGKLIIGGQSDSAQQSKPIADREAKRSSSAFKVRVSTLQPQSRHAQLLIRGRTKADATITVRAETGGILTKRAVMKGDKVKPGDLLCVIDQGIRKSNLAQAKARLDQAKADFDANDELFTKGFTTKSKLHFMRAALNAAVASLDAAEQDLKRTDIRASVYGEVTSPLAEAGDHLSPGGICVTLIDTDPMLFIGQVSERDISRLQTGMAAGVQLVTGEQVLGKISYIAPNADPKTRTFRVEIGMNNEKHTLRDGVTASSIVKLESTEAFKVKPSWLTLADSGDIGLRGVDADNKVIFVPVKILSQASDGMWVSGIKPGTSIITLGQEYVSAGEIVDPVSAVAKDKDASKKKANAASSNAVQSASIKQ